MKLVPIKYKMKCDVGGCNGDAVFRLQPDNVGVHAGLHLCPECAKEIHRVTTPAVRMAAARSLENDQ